MNEKNQTDYDELEKTWRETLSVRGIGSKLDKMDGDHWRNAVKLITGEWFVAEHCVIYGEWVLFTDISEAYGFPDEITTGSWRGGYPLFARGLEVRLDSIAWIVEQGH